MLNNEKTTSLFVQNSIANFSISGYQSTEDLVIVTELKLFPDIQENRTNLQEQSSVYGSLYEYAKKIQQFMEGTLKDLVSIPVQLDFFSSFQQRVLTAARKIEYGSTVSYSKLAEMAGSQTAVRATATVMRKNKYPIIIPCHRVIRTNGEIGGYSGMQSGEAIELKRQLLRNEGVILN
jgi:O-6-methylguanine DNA methyltransferase